MEKLLINGYTGRFGQVLYQHLKPKYHLLGANQTHDLKSMVLKHSPDLIIDVSSSKVINEFIPLYQALQIPTIIGTSGILPKDAFQITQTNFPLLIVPNFSLSFQAFVTQCQSLARFADQITIEETHHQRKVDSPSGSGLFLAHLLNTKKIVSYRVDYYLTKHTVILDSNTQRMVLSHEIKNPMDFLPGVDAALEKLKHLKKGLVLFSDR